jgi:4-hydroxy-3-methylbut-2-en-1-yl diphosphate reductase
MNPSPLGASRACILAFDSSNRIAVRERAGRISLDFAGDDGQEAALLLGEAFPSHTTPTPAFEAADRCGTWRVLFSQVAGSGSPGAAGLQFRSIEALEADAERLEPPLPAILAALGPHLMDIPYLHLGENDFIYKFRPEKERNDSIYAQDAQAGSLYQSRLFAAIKALARRHERTAADPVVLDFGPVVYVVPSHFGFCLGVRNAIERAYETLAENPGARVFMLSELIHNPFVNEDLIRRGLRYLQTDKGVPYGVDGTAGSAGRQLWDTLTPDDIVIIPAFGATDDDKRRLVRKGIAVYPYDATCMLVEKVWKAARSYGRDGYTVVIHGKHEHEETKATFSNTRRHAQAVIVRNLEETTALGRIISSDDPAVRAEFYALFKGKHTPGFDVGRHLERVAVVNQTTLLMNETREIIAYLREVYAARYGPDAPGAQARVGGSGRNDTLCYATQVNQDALACALAGPLDAALVIGGKNSSNTYQLYRLCQRELGERAFFIQGEASVRSPRQVDHYVFPARGQPAGAIPPEARPLWSETPGAAPRRILVTGGASCPDGIIQQVINRINSFFPASSLRSPEAVLRDLGKGQPDA